MRHLAVLCLSLLAFSCSKKPEQPALPSVPVIASPVLVRDQPVYFEAMGQAIGSRDVEIRARAEGILESIEFREGSYIEEGALLYTIDPRTLEGNLEQARGNLAQAEAALDKARRDVARLTPLWEKNAISRQMLDDALAAGQSTEGMVNTARAAVENMEIQLGYTKIYAPISGIIGKTEVKPGNLVGRGASTLLTIMSSLDPVHVRFSVSEKAYLEFRRAHPDSGTEPSGTNNIVELILADGTDHPHKGHIVFVDRNVDPATGTLLMEAAFPNPGLVIRPGQFGRIRVPVSMIPGAVLVPQRAVTELQATYSVFVATAAGTAEFRKVTPGPRIGNMIIIAEGLRPGENVVIEGGQKLQHNSPVAVEIKPFDATGI